MSLSWCQPLLVSLSWYKPLLASLSWCQPLLVSLSLAQTGGKLSVATRWMCQYPYRKNTGCTVWFKPGGKVTCRNSKTARSLRRVSALWSAASSRHYRGTNPSSCRYRGANPSSCRYRWLKQGWQPRGVRNNHWVQPRGVRYNHWVQPRAVTTRFVTRGRRRTRTRCCPVGWRVHA